MKQRDWLFIYGGILLVGAWAAYRFGVTGAQAPYGWVILACCVFSAWQVRGQQEKSRVEAIATNRSAARSDRKTKLIEIMLKRGYQIDQDGEIYLQFRKPKQSPAKSFFFLIVGIALMFVAMPLGAIALAAWFISLFFAGRNEIKTFSLPE